MTSQPTSSWGSLLGTRYGSPDMPHPSAWKQRVHASIRAYSSTSFSSESVWITVVLVGQTSGVALEASNTRQGVSTGRRRSGTRRWLRHVMAPALIGPTGRPGPDEQPGPTPADHRFQLASDTAAKRFQASTSTASITASPCRGAHSTEVDPGRRPGSFPLRPLGQLLGGSGSGVTPTQGYELGNGHVALTWATPAASSGSTPMMTVSLSRPTE
jgi:hypothetical protein